MKSIKHYRNSIFLVLLLALSCNKTNKDIIEVWRLHSEYQNTHKSYSEFYFLRDSVILCSEGSFLTKSYKKTNTSLELGSTRYALKTLDDNKVIAELNGVKDTFVVSLVDDTIWRSFLYGTYQYHDDRKDENSEFNEEIGE